MDYRRPKRTLVRVKYKGIAPHQLVRTAAAFNRRQRDQYDEVWCVVDVDEYDIDAAVRVARPAGVSLAVSNPCFEYWLLLHHTDSSAPLPRCTAVEDLLRRHVPSYDKTKLQFADYEFGVSDAVARARRRDSTGQSWQRNPSTNMWQLVERIMEER